MFDWQCHPEAESWLESLLQEFQEQDPHLAELEKVLQEKTSTRLFDWLDHFTKAEQWPVKPERIKKLLKAGYITWEQANLFLGEGAVGSHLENLQRKEGYKGFNKDNVSVIIKKTDPRLYKD